LAGARQEGDGIFPLFIRGANVADEIMHTTHKRLANLLDARVPGLAEPLDHGVGDRRLAEVAHGIPSDVIFRLVFQILPPLQKDAIQSIPPGE
jgi:hypothetical protein